MSLTDGVRLASASSGSSVLPLIGSALFLLLIVALGAGTWAGNRWSEGSNAIKKAKEHEAYIETLQVEITSLREIAAATLIDYAAAVDRLDAIAEQREEDRHDIEIHRQRVAQSLEALRAARPDLFLRAGDDVLQHWRQSNTRPTAAPSGTQRPGEREATVPGPAAASERPVDQPDRQPRRDGAAVPRLPERDGSSGRRGGGSLGDPVGLVLQGAPARRHHPDRGCLPA